MMKIGRTGTFGQFVKVGVFFCEGGALKVFWGGNFWNQQTWGNFVLPQVWEYILFLAGHLFFLAGMAAFTAKQ